MSRHILKETKLQKIRFNSKRDLPIYFLLLPSIILVIIFNYFPIYGAVIAFKDFSPGLGILKSDWIGFDNFNIFLKDPYFWRVIFNTLKINIFSLIFGFPAPIIFALLLNEVSKRWFKSVVQTISYLPFFISWVVVASIVYTITAPESGLINILLSKFGINSIYFMSEEKFFVPVVVISGIWKGTGMSSIYYLASLSSIDPQLYDSCYLEGAGRWRQTIHITLPGLRNIITVMLVLQLGSIASIGFDNIFLLQNPLLYKVSDVISTYTYRIGLINMQYSLTAAIGLTQSFVNFILVIGANQASKKLTGWSLW